MKEDILPYLSHKHFLETERNKYQKSQIGYQVKTLFDQDFYNHTYDIILLGCGEFRGFNDEISQSFAPDKIREEFYLLYQWQEIKIADIGNIILGKDKEDTYAAIATVVGDLLHENSKIMFLGGSDDLMHGLYKAFKNENKIIEISLIDSKIDLIQDDVNINSMNYVYSLLLDKPNFTQHLNLLGFQSYFVSPDLLEALDKLRFDFLRLGRIKEDIELCEPMLRNSQLIGVDLNATMAYLNPANKQASPNGIDGQEICAIMRYIGMSSQNKICGIFNYFDFNDNHNITAKLCAQMIWYFIEGVSLGKLEADFDDLSEFLLFNVEINQNTIAFKKSKRTNRWWMQIDSKVWMPCTFHDYLEASRNIIPERYLRAKEK